MATEPESVQALRKQWYDAQLSFSRVVSSLLDDDSKDDAPRRAQNLNELDANDDDDDARKRRRLEKILHKHEMRKTLMDKNAELREYLSKMEALRVANIRLASQSIRAATLELVPDTLLDLFDPQPEQVEKDEAATSSGGRLKLEPAEQVEKAEAGTSSGDPYPGGTSSDGLSARSMAILTDSWEAMW